jgi:hypothetical protein
MGEKFAYKVSLKQSTAAPVSSPGPFPFSGRNLPTISFPFRVLHFQVMKNRLAHDKYDIALLRG